MITVGTRVRIRGNVETAVPGASDSMIDETFLRWMRRFEGATGTVVSVSSGGTAEVEPDDRDLLDLAFSDRVIGWRVEDLTTDLVPELGDRAAVDAWLDS